MVRSFVQYRSSIFRHGLATLAALLLTAVSVAIDTNREVSLDNKKLEAIVNGITDSIDRQFQAWRLAMQAMSVSSALDPPYNMVSFSDEARRFAALTDTHLAFYHAEGAGLTLLSHTRLPNSELPKYFSKEQIPIFFETMQEVQKTNKAAVSNLFVGPIAGEYQASLVLPRAPGDGRDDYLSLNFSARELSDLLAEIALPKDFIAGIVDQNGVIAARSTDPQPYIGKVIPDWYREEIYKHDSGFAQGNSVVGPPFREYRFVFKHLKEAKGWAVSMLVPPTFYPQFFISPMSMLIGMGLLMGANFIAWLTGSTQRKQIEVERRYQDLTHKLLDELPGSVLRGHMTAAGRFEIDLCLGRLADQVGRAGVFKFEKQLFAEMKKVPSRSPLATQFEFDVRDEERIFRLFAFETERIFESGGAQKSYDERRELNIYILDITNQRAAELAAINSARLAALGQMAATLAHEMSQPINVISLAADNAETMIEDRNFAGVPGKIQKIRDFAKKSRYLIDNLLAFARGDTVDKPMINVDLRSAILLAEELTHSMLVREQVHLLLDLPDEDIGIRGRPIELENIFVNLIVNSVDAFKQSDIRDNRQIAIHVKRAGDMVNIRVCDNAGGIAPDVLPRIFEPFMTTKSQGHGTGLGLSFVSGHIRSWGGDISVRNEQGGAVFAMRLQHAVSPVIASDAAE